MISRVWCGECGYSEHFRSGIGMRHGSLDRCISEFPYWERQKLESVREEKALSDYHFSFVLAQCQTCLNLMDKPFIEFQFQNGAHEHSGMCCTYCESESVRLIHEDRLDAARCPYCKEKSLEQQLEGMWD